MGLAGEKNYGHIYVFVALTLISVSASSVVTRKALGCSYDSIKSFECSDLYKIFLSNIIYSFDFICMFPGLG